MATYQKLRKWLNAPREDRVFLLLLVITALLVTLVVLMKG